ncbi:MAG: hypothetical protein LUI06_02545 [Ruminococcus sp.]|nr:hypothetical protein [Ruminococcus sp.]
MNSKRLLALALALGMLASFSGCREVDDDSSDSLVTTEAVEASSDASEADQSSTEEESAAQSGEESEEGTADVDADEESEAEESEADDAFLESQDSSYVNHELGFTLPLPEGTECEDQDDEFKASFDDEDVQFRSIMDTVSNDRFNLTVQIYQTEKTLDDFAEDREEYVDSKNSSSNEDDTEAVTYEILSSDMETIGTSDDAVNALVVTEKQTSDSSVFCTLRVYIELYAGQYIYIQGNCYDEDTLATLRECAEGFMFIN